jgi:hypothetical protein
MTLSPWIMLVSFFGQFPGKKLRNPMFMGIFEVSTGREEKSFSR